MCRGFIDLAGICEQLDKLPWPSFGLPFVQLTGSGKHSADLSSLSNPLSKPKQPNPILFRVDPSAEVSEKEALEYVEWDGERLAEQSAMTTYLTRVRPYGILLVVPDQVICS